MKKLFRIKNESNMLGGVCLGLSEYLDVDVTLLRILFVVGFFTPMPVVIAYIVMWIIMPVKTVYSLESTNSSKNE